MKIEVGQIYVRFHPPHGWMEFINGPEWQKIVVSGITFYDDDANDSVVSFTSMAGTTKRLTNTVFLIAYCILRP